MKKKFTAVLVLAFALAASASFAAQSTAAAGKTEKKNAATAAIERITAANSQTAPKSADKTAPKTAPKNAPKTVVKTAPGSADKTAAAGQTSHYSSKTASLDAMIAQKVKERENQPKQTSADKTAAAAPVKVNQETKPAEVKPAAQKAVTSQEVKVAAVKPAAQKTVTSQEVKAAAVKPAAQKAAASQEITAAAVKPAAQKAVADGEAKLSGAAKPVLSSAGSAATAAAAAAQNLTDTAALAGRPLKPSEMKAGEPETAESLLVSAEWLKTHKGQVVLVDSRPESLYAGGHIPGAVNASWTYFANMSAPTGTMKYGTVYNASTMARRVGALGINGSKTVVAYCDAGGWGQSGWTVWILRMCGIKNAKILNGGFTAWKQAGGAVTRAKSSNKAVPFKVAAYKPNYLVNTEWINDNLGKPGLAIIDVRTAAEYAGKIRPFQEKRAGHLPTAINLELEKFVTSDFHYREVQEIKDLLTANNITPETEIVVYDTAGVRAAFVTMVLRYAGYTKSQCYDEGFQAWAGKAELPLEK